MRFLFFTVISLVLTLSACGPTKEDAIKYSNSIVDSQQEASKQIDSAFTALNTYDTVLIAKTIKKAEAQIQDSKTKIESLGDFHGDSLLSAPAQKYMTTLDNHLKNEFKSIYKLYCIPDSLYSEENRLESEKLSKTINSERKDALDKLIKAQLQFATKYEFSFENASDSLPKE